MANERAVMSGNTGAITRMIAFTKSDTVALTDGTARALYVGGSGDVAVVVAVGATPVVLTGLAAGIWHPIHWVRINSTGTTATAIVAGY